MSGSTRVRKSRDNKAVQLVLARTTRLVDQANRCRRLALGLPDETVRQKLLALAAEYETKVRTMTRGKPVPGILGDLRCR
jgi:hypothetical protein